MTIERKVATTEDTLYRVLGSLTMEGACEATNRKPEYLRVLSHPDRRECLTFDDAIALDLAHNAFDGTARSSSCLAPGSSWPSAKST